MSKTYLTEDELNELIYKLRNTSDNIDTEIFLMTQGKVEDLTIEQQNELENEILHCDHCGYWKDAYTVSIDYTGTNICNECEEIEDFGYDDEDY